MMPPADTLDAEREKVGLAITLATDHQLLAEIAERIAIRRDWPPPATEHQLAPEPLEVDGLVEALAAKTEGLVVLAVMPSPTIHVPDAPPPRPHRAWCKNVGLATAARMAESFTVSCRQELEQLRLRLSKGKKT